MVSKIIRFLHFWGNVGIWPAYFALWMTFVFEDWYPHMFSGITGDFPVRTPKFQLSVFKWFHLNFSDWPSWRRRWHPPRKIKDGQISDSLKHLGFSGWVAYPNKKNTCSGSSNLGIPPNKTLAPGLHKLLVLKIRPPGNDLPRLFSLGIRGLGLFDGFLKCWKTVQVDLFSS